MEIARAKLTYHLMSIDNTDASNLIQDVHVKSSNYTLEVARQDLQFKLSCYGLPWGIINDIEAALFSQNSDFKEFFFYASPERATLKAILGTAARIYGTENVVVRLSAAIASGKIVPQYNKIAKPKLKKSGKPHGKKHPGYVMKPRDLTPDELYKVEKSLKYNIREALLTGFY